MVKHKIKQSLKHHFIPCDENEYTPHSLRPKALLHYVGVVFLVKVIMTIGFFSLYPTPAVLIKGIPERMTELINQTRTENNIHILENNTILSLAAEAKAQDMVQKSYFNHSTPDGKTPWDFINRNEYRYMAAGENLAMGFTSPETAHDALLASVSHRHIIFNDRYNEIGVGVAYGIINGKQTTVLVEFFGSIEPKSQYLTRKEKSFSIASIPYSSKQIPISTTKKENGTVAGENIEIEELTTPSEMIISVPETNKALSLANRITTTGNTLLTFVLLYLFVALSLNLLIHIRIQKPKVIAQSFVVLGVTLFILLGNFHFIETLLEKAILLM